MFLRAWHTVDTCSVCGESAHGIEGYSACGWLDRNRIFSRVNDERKLLVRVSLGNLSGNKHLCLGRWERVSSCGCGGGEWGSI